MTQCRVCNKSITYQCKYCGSYYCFYHQHPKNHKCKHTLQKPPKNLQPHQQQHKSHKTPQFQKTQYKKEESTGKKILNATGRGLKTIGKGIKDTIIAMNEDRVRNKIAKEQQQKIDRQNYHNAYVVAKANADAQQDTYAERRHAREQQRRYNQWQRNLEDQFIISPPPDDYFTQNKKKKKKTNENYFF